MFYNEGFNIDNFIYTQQLIDDITEMQQLKLFNIRDITKTCVLCLHVCFFERLHLTARLFFCKWTAKCSYMTINRFCVGLKVYILINTQTFTDHLGKCKILKKYCTAWR